MNGSTSAPTYTPTNGGSYYNPSYQPWPPTTYYCTSPVPISDADVERIAQRVAELLKPKPARKVPAKK